MGGGEELAETSSGGGGAEWRGWVGESSGGAIARRVCWWAGGGGERDEYLGGRGCLGDGGATDGPAGGVGLFVGARRGRRRGGRRVDSWQCGSAAVCWAQGTRIDVFGRRGVVWVEMRPWRLWCCCCLDGSAPWQKRPPPNFTRVPLEQQTHHNCLIMSSALSDYRRYPRPHLPCLVQP